MSDSVEKIQTQAVDITPSIKFYFFHLYIFIKDQFEVYLEHEVLGFGAIQLCECMYTILTQMSCISLRFIVHQGVKGARRHGEQVTCVSGVCAVRKNKQKKRTDFILQTEMQIDLCDTVSHIDFHYNWSDNILVVPQVIFNPLLTSVCLC